MRVIENPKIISIVSFLKIDPEQLEKSLTVNQSLYIIDNMILTKIRKDIVDIPFMLKGFHASNLIVIPDIILEEASENLENEQVFRKYYYELFRTLSRENEIFVVSVETLFQLLHRMVGKNDALFTLKNITIEAVRINQTISDLIKSIEVNSPTVLEELRDAIIHNGKNAGERFISIFGLVFLNLFYGPIYIFSEDVKGTYGAFRTFIENERLMELINVDDTVDLIEGYQFLSYESFIQAVFLEGNLNKDELLELINTSSRNQSRHILYNIDGHPCYTSISNEQLAEWISENRIKIQF